MALCWILHLTGDLHQPLHTVALFSAEFFPSGDRGGNYIDEWLTRHAGLAARFVCTAELKSQVLQGQANSRPGVVLLSHE